MTLPPLGLLVDEFFALLVAHLHHDVIDEARADDRGDAEDDGDDAEKVAGIVYNNSLVQKKSLLLQIFFWNLLMRILIHS